MKKAQFTPPLGPSILTASLSHVEIGLGEDILEALMVSVDIAMGSHKMMPPYLESIDNCKDRWTKRGGELGLFSISKIR